MKKKDIKELFSKSDWDENTISIANDIIEEI